MPAGQISRRARRSQRKAMIALAVLRMTSTDMLDRTDWFSPSSGDATHELFQ